MKKLFLCVIVILTLTTSCSQQTEAEKTGESEIATSNAVIKTIMQRRSVRQYLATPVEREKLQQVVECGINAPNGMNKQPWEVTVVEDSAFILGTTELFKAAMPDMVAKDRGFKNMYRNAPNIICIATPNGESSIDAGLLGENIILAAQSLGLGTCCLGGPVAFLKSSEDCKPYIEKLGFSDGYELLYIIAIGYPDETPEAKPRDAGKVRFL